jgi:hypothetical protein
VLLLFVLAAILVVIGAVLVFLWYVGQAQSTGAVPATLGQWTMAAVVTFLLNLIFWEIVLIGIPIIVAAAVFWQWWRKLPFEERQEYRFFRTRSRSRNGGSAFSLIVFIAFCFKISLDGNWNAPFSGWTFDYLVYSYITALLWILAIIAIPAVFGIIWWIGYGRKKH